MRTLRKIGLIIASAVLSVMGLSGCASKFMPLMYGVPNPNPPQENIDSPDSRLEKNIGSLEVVNHPQ